MELNTLLLGDSLAKLKELEDNSVDSIVTDPPYGLGKEPDPVEVMTDWIEKGYHEVKSKQGGFMGKAWDAFVPQPIVWKECYRVLKPGGYLLAFFSSRTIDWGTMALRFAGFEIRDTIEYFFDETEAGQEFVNSLTKEQQEMLFRLNDATCMHGISWLQGQGFPKSLDISKEIDRINGAERTNSKLKFKGGTQLGVINDDSWKPKDVYESVAVTPEAITWTGYGTGLKPAHENIVMCRKPISERTVAENVLKWGIGGINIDGCRVPLLSGVDDSQLRTINRNVKTDDDGWRLNDKVADTSQVIRADGRFPANVIFECTCDELLESGEANIPYEYKDNEYKVEGFIHNIKPNSPSNYNDHKHKVVHTNPNCPCYQLDRQSGKLKSGSNAVRTKASDGYMGGIQRAGVVHKTYGDTGGASRFFYVAKATKKERNLGVSNVTFTVDGEEVTGNFHPTVKPLELMRYLVRLVTPKGGICLDPFIGSGTTAMACILEECNFIGIDNNQDYLKIAELRIKEVVGG